MAAGSIDKAAWLAQLNRLSIDDGRGDMMSENRAANERFRQNSEALQQRQAANDPAPPAPGIDPVQEQDEPKEPGLTSSDRPGLGYNDLKQEQSSADITELAPEQARADRELSFGPGREPQQYRDVGPLEMSGPENSRAQTEPGERELSFGPDRESRNYDALKREQSGAEIEEKDRGQEQTRELTFGFGREQGQEYDQGLGR